MLSEIIFALLFQGIKSGYRFPHLLENLLSYIYQHHCRDYILYHYERGRYDEELFYTLRPGVFRHSNIEFSNFYQVNSAGFRDDEISLDYPEIVFSGDSYTMGWGVEQDESFAAVLENRLKIRGLNMGIASFGTAREYLALRRIKLDSCRLLILQFCPNDVRENRSFIEQNFKLNISPPAVFEKEIIWNRLYSWYYPMKYFHAACCWFTRKMKEMSCAGKDVADPPSKGLSETHLADFFAILDRIKSLYNGPIVLFNLGMGFTQPQVHRQFEQWIKDHSIKNVYVFPVTDYLSREDYLALDWHLTKEGNRKVAEAMENFIQKNGLNFFVKFYNSSVLSK